MRIPEIRHRLRELAEELGCSELSDLADELKRRPTRDRAAATSKRMTASLGDAIRAYHKAHPDLSQVEVGRVFNVNQGRVSEALRGFRE